MNIKAFLICFLITGSCFADLDKSYTSENWKLWRYDEEQYIEQQKAYNLLSDSSLFDSAVYIVDAYKTTGEPCVKIVVKEFDIFKQTAFNKCDNNKELMNFTSSFSLKFFHKNVTKDDNIYFMSFCARNQSLLSLKCSFKEIK